MPSAPEERNAVLATVVRRVLAELARRGETAASCESLTGGLVGSVITDVAGSSAVYRGGMITYATELKAGLAGVRQATLDAYGAVAAPTAREMATGTARVCAADWGLATTGVAGPDPQEGHPAGTVFVAVAGPGPAVDSGAADPVVAEQLSLTGDRDDVRRQTVLAVMQLFERILFGTGARG